ncbi:S66 peptidase family protein [Cryobacterium sp. Sr3]|uniref:S66 family peptidase n=1 Tax=Cryobacterium sp. Sr3 TaxID=1259194 RepID=UPI001F53FE47|nr:S66 peptidase family protein [Cryobacterium sp. Sr3]
MTIVPPKLRSGDIIRVVAPARSKAFATEHLDPELIERRFKEMGLVLTFGQHVDERDAFDSSSIASRVADLHAAFADPDVKAILTVIGGSNSNELLPYLDWDLIASNPKILCGYSNITALQNAILARTGLVTYSGPHWSSFGMRDHFERTAAWFTQTLFDDAPVNLLPSPEWTDDLWFLDQDVRVTMPSQGWWTLQDGHAEGQIIGTNMTTIAGLQGTPYMPSLNSSILVLEDTAGTDPADFARHLTSILQLPDAVGVLGLVIGRFQTDTGMTQELLTEIISRQPVLKDLPVLANVDVGHSSPQATFPIGGTLEITVGSNPSLQITRH